MNRHKKTKTVYQRTVAELESKGGKFWLAFVPLAIDVDERKEGLERGLQYGLQQGHEYGLEDGLAPLVYQFERRLGRALTEASCAESNRDFSDGPENLGAVVLDLARQELATWLEPRKTTAKRRAA